MKNSENKNKIGIREIPWWAFRKRYRYFEALEKYRPSVKFGRSKRLTLLYLTLTRYSATVYEGDNLLFEVIKKSETEPSWFSRAIRADNKNSLILDVFLSAIIFWTFSSLPFVNYLSSLLASLVGIVIVHVLHMSYIWKNTGAAKVKDSFDINKDLPEKNPDAVIHLVEPQLEKIKAPEVKKLMYILENIAQIDQANQNFMERFYEQVSSNPEILLNYISNRALAKRLYDSGIFDYLGVTLATLPPDSSILLFEKGFVGVIENEQLTLAYTSGEFTLYSSFEGKKIEIMVDLTSQDVRLSVEHLPTREAEREQSIESSKLETTDDDLDDGRSGGFSKDDPTIALGDDSAFDRPPAAPGQPQIHQPEMGALPQRFKP